MALAVYPCVLLLGFPLWGLPGGARLCLNTYGSLAVRSMLVVL